MVIIFDIIIKEVKILGGISVSDNITLENDNDFALESCSNF